MSIKSDWCDKFEELLWEHHTCDWEYANKNPDYPFQIAVAYFDWKYEGNQAVRPAYSVEEAFKRYLEDEND